MIIVVEGPSAAGKTSWITARCQPASVVGEAEPGPAPDRERNPAAAAAHWAGVSAGRWAKACRLERLGGLAVCDTDPFKLHYVWCLWRIGEVSAAAWRAERDASRRLFASQRLGVADLILISIPDPAILAARRAADTAATGRRRRNFDLHARLAHPLRDWYQAVGRLAPGRVRWELPRSGLDRLTDAGQRRPRTGPDLFNALIDQLPAR